MFEKIRNQLMYRGYWDDEPGAGGGGPADPPPSDPPAEPVDPPAASATPTWPDNWRQQLAGENKDAMKTLERFASPAALYQSYASIRQQRDSGELKAVVPFPEKGSDEEKSNWRKENGIPEAPDKYDLTFDDGLVIGDDDKPIIDDFLTAAHNANMAPSHVKGVVKWYYDLKEKRSEHQQELDRQTAEATQDELRTEWGGEYKRNLNLIHGLLDTAPEGIKDNFINGRMADGTPIGSNPGMLKFMIDLARQINPPTTVIPGAGQNIAGAIDDEIASIEKVMREDRKRYNGDQKMQARLRELYGAKEKVRKSA